MIFKKSYSWTCFVSFSYWRPNHKAIVSVYSRATLTNSGTSLLSSWTENKVNVNAMLYRKLNSSRAASQELQSAPDATSASACVAGTRTFTSQLSWVIMLRGFTKVLIHPGPCPGNAGHGSALLYGRWKRRDERRSVWCLAAGDKYIIARRRRQRRQQTMRALLWRVSCQRRRTPAALRHKYQ